MIRIMLLSGAVLVSGVAAAAPRDFVVEHAGAGGNAQAAAPYIDKFLRFAEKALGWPASSTSGTFYAEPAEIVKELPTKKPGFGMLDPDVLLELKKKESLTVLASVESPKNNLGKLHLVVKDPSIKTLEDLKGKTLVSNHLQSARFLSKVAFEGKIDVAKFFGKLQEAPGMLKGVKAVDRGEAAATLLSDAELASLKTMSYPELRVLWSSKELPPMAVVAFGKNAQPKDKEAFGKMLKGMCESPEGKQVCTDLDIVKFTPPADALYQAAQKRYDQ